MVPEGGPLPYNSPGSLFVTHPPMPYPPLQSPPHTRYADGSKSPVFVMAHCRRPIHRRRRVLLLLFLSTVQRPLCSTTTKPYAVLCQKKNYIIFYTYIILLLSYRNDYTCTDKCKNILYTVIKCIVKIIKNIINKMLV